MSDRPPEADDLNLIPIMNLVTLLIPFLLLSAQFVSYAVIDSTLLAICATGCDEAQPPDQPLNLTLTLSASGYDLRADSERHPDLGEGARFPCRTASCGGPLLDAWDVPGLRAALADLKHDHPGEDHAILVPSPEVPYEAVILAMDALREDPDQPGDGACEGRCLFPLVTIAGGVAAN